MATGIGETLRTARRTQGRSLADAAAQTRIRETYLAALEAEEFAALGGDVYVKGFLRSYARFLHVDPEPLLDIYRHEHEHHEEQVGLAQPSMQMPAERSPMLFLAIGGGVVLLLVLAFIGLRAGNGDPEPGAEPPPPPVRETPAVEQPPPEEEEAPAAQVDPEAAAVEGAELTVTIHGPASWLRVVVDEERMLEGERSSGFTEVFRGDEAIVVRVGDAAAVEVVFNGEDQGALGRSGQVVQLTCTAGQTVCEREEIT